MTAEQTRQSIVNRVTGRAGVLPEVQAEAASPTVSQTETAPLLPPELQETLDWFTQGFPNVLVYRAFKGLEARITALEVKR